MSSLLDTFYIRNFRQQNSNYFYMGLNTQQIIHSLVHMEYNLLILGLTIQNLKLNQYMQIGLKSDI